VRARLPETLSVYQPIGASGGEAANDLQRARPDIRRLVSCNGRPDVRGEVGPDPAEFVMVTRQERANSLAGLIHAIKRRGGAQEQGQTRGQ
jgi:hypothetical protein